MNSKVLFVVVIIILLLIIVYLAYGYFDTSSDQLKQTEKFDTLNNYTSVNLKKPLVISPLSSSSESADNISTTAHTTPFNTTNETTTLARTTEAQMSGAVNIVSGSSDYTDSSNTIKNVGSNFTSAVSSNTSNNSSSDSNRSKQPYTLNSDTGTGLTPQNNVQGVNANTGNSDNINDFMKDANLLGNNIYVSPMNNDQLYNPQAKLSQLGKITSSFFPIIKIAQ